MANSWIEGAGRLAVPSFYIFIGLMLTIIHLKRRRGAGQDAGGGGEADVKARPDASVEDGKTETRVDRVLNIMLEYVGNVDAGPDWSREERRRNPSARLLMDHIRSDLSRRDVPQVEMERLVEDLRESMRSRGPDQAG